MADIIGIDNINMSELTLELQKGAKFVTYPVVISFILATERTSSDIFFIRHNESAFIKGVPSFFKTFVFGWWGLPYGLIYTPLALIKIMMGGNDVTGYIMSDIIQQQNNQTYINLNICPNCKKENEINSKFCIFCGTNIKENTTNSDNETLITCAITLIAYVAKADGVVSQNEAKIISELLNYLSDNDITFRNNLKNIYNNAKNREDKNYNYFAQLIYEIAKQKLDNVEQKQFFEAFTRWLMMLVYADNTRNYAQSLITEEIVKYLPISKTYLNELYNEFENLQQKDNKKSNNSHKISIEECYVILKSDVDFTNEEIKKSYRELVKQYHPDTIQGKGLADDFILFANQKFKEINNAYEIIKKYRGMK